MKKSIPNLYYNHFIKNDDERLELFQVIRTKFNIKKGLYPGSYVHITPSFIFPEMVYVDNDKRCNIFFSEPNTFKLIKDNKVYPNNPILRFHFADFTKGFPEEENSFDLLISLYSGFVSKHCKKYLKKGGILIANNSHGDSSLAYLDLSFKFIGAIKRRGNNFKFTDQYLDSYFITKNGKPIDKNKIENTMRGAGFKKTGYAYVFTKNKKG